MCERCEILIPNGIYLYFPRDEAEMWYLKISQDLEMYGINYFQIKVMYIREACSL